MSTRICELPNYIVGTFPSSVTIPSNSHGKSALCCGLRSFPRAESISDKTVRYCSRSSDFSPLIFFLFLVICSSDYQYFANVV